MGSKVAVSGVVFLLTFVVLCALNPPWHRNPLITMQIPQEVGKEDYCLVKYNRLVGPGSSLWFLSR